ncbi:MAG TPA: insulinase family protein [Geothrix sp.]|nr:insulinase family protein [Geothrix sp.]
MRPLLLLLTMVLCLQGQTPNPGEVQERRLANGMRLLWVERRDLDAFHATLVLRGGRAEEPPALTGATDLLARSLFGPAWPEDLATGKASQEFDSMLKQEEGLMEALRLARLRALPDVESTVSGLEASLQSVRGQLRTRLSTAPLTDLYAAAGGWQRAEGTEDALMVHTELPLGAFDLWCQTEHQRLSLLRISRFYETKAAFLKEVRAKGAQALDLILGAALPGHPYGRNFRDHLPAIEAMRASELRTYTRRTLNPEHMALIVVSSLSLDRSLPALEAAFGSLPMPPENEETLLAEIPSDLGDRRVQVNLGEAPSLLAAWRIPPRSHQDHLALRMAAQILDGGHTSRIQARLVGGKALAKSATLLMDLPGARLPGLLLAELVPAEGHSLEEVEAALHSEILRLQQEPIAPEEWTRALAQLEVDHLRILDEPAALARALGHAWVETGDWHRLDLEMQRLRTLQPEAVQAAVRTWLTASHRTTALLRPALLENSNPLDLRTNRVLQALAALRVEDPAQREHLVTEGARQLRMLSLPERLRTLELLEAQLPQEKR